jgi:predicted dienelactone hydrolase
MEFFRGINRADVVDTTHAQISSYSTRKLEVHRTNLILEDDTRDKKKLFTAIYWTKLNASPEKRPVLIFSHGVLSDCNSYVFLGLKLAEQGYVVIVPTHTDSLYLNGGFSTMIKRGGMEKETKRLVEDPNVWLDRCRDVHFLVDRLDQILIQIPELQNTLDTSKVGVLGHSYGAQTCLALGGTTLISRGE